MPSPPDVPEGRGCAPPPRWAMVGRDRSRPREPRIERLAALLEVLGPVVAVQVRIGLDRLAAIPDLVELAVGADLADPNRLPDVLVLLVDLDGATRSGELQVLGRFLDLVHLDGVGL